MPRETRSLSSPAIGADGTIYVGSEDGKLYAIYSSSPGLANSPWPMFHHDLKHTGNPAPLLTLVLLTVTKSGTGTGIVTSSPSGINCGSACSMSFPPGATVTLSATPSAGSAFAGWSEGCSGTGTCTVTTNSDATVTANFTRSTYTLTATATGAGSGTLSATDHFLQRRKLVPERTFTIRR